MNPQNTLDQLINDVKTRDYRRFLAIQRAPAASRAALYTLTAFYLELATIPEHVTDPMIGAIRLTWWREAIEELTAGKAPRAHPVIQCIAALLNEGPITSQSLISMVNAREPDLDPTLLATDAQFLAYLDATGGTLHRLWAEYISPEETVAAQATRITHLSRAYALIGLLRSIPHLASRGLIRFPTTRIDSLTPGESLHIFVHSQHNKALKYLEASKNLSGPHAALHAIARSDAAQLMRVGYDPYDIRLARERRLTLVWQVIRS